MPECHHKVPASPYVLELTSDPQNIAAVEPYLRNAFEQLPCSYTDEQYGKILIALTEAVNNAILHGNRCAAGKKVLVRLEHRLPHTLTFTVQDEGCGFDPGSLPDPTHPDRLLECGGRGVFLMRHLCDQIRFRKRGTCVEMHFRVCDTAPHGTVQ